MAMALEVRWAHVR